MRDESETGGDRSPARLSRIPLWRWVNSRRSATEAGETGAAMTRCAIVLLIGRSGNGEENRNGFSSHGHHLARAYHGINTCVGRILVPSGKKTQSPISRGGYFGSGLGARGMSASLVPTIPRQPISVRFRHSHGGTEPNSTED